MLNYLIRKNNGTKPKRKQKIANLKRCMVMICESNFKIFFIELIVTTFCSALPIIVALIWRTILNIVEYNFELLSPKLLCAFFVYAILGAFSKSYFYFTEIIDSVFRNRLSIAFQKKIHDKASRIPLIYHDDPQIKDYITRAEKTFCYGSAIGIAMAISYFISSFVSFVAALFLLLKKHYLLAAAFALLLIPICFKDFVNNVRAKMSISTESNRREADIYASYISGYDYSMEVKFLNLGPVFLEKWKAKIKKIHSVERFAILKCSFLNILAEALDVLIYCVTIFIGAMLIRDGEIRTGDFGALFVLIEAVRQNASNLIKDYSAIDDYIVQINYGFHYLDLQEEYRKEEQSIDFNKGVACENLSFSYPLREEKAVNGVNLKLEPGTITALVGKNGSGKSTLAKLLLGLYLPETGSVYYDGIEVEKLSYNCLFQKVSAVFQDYNRYCMSVKENIGISDIRNIHDSARIHRVLMQMGVSSVYENLPDGLDTFLGKELGGTELSGGQWQDLAIARAYFKRKSAFVVLDEPTAALDPLREQELFIQFKQLCSDKIGLIITHRLAAATLADQICLMENGRVVESGTHDELMKHNGVYSKMFRAQSSLYDR